LIARDLSAILVLLVGTSFLRADDFEARIFKVEQGTVELKENPDRPKEGRFGQIREFDPNAPPKQPAMQKVTLTFGYRLYYRQWDTDKERYVRGKEIPERFENQGIEKLLDSPTMQRIGWPAQVFTNVNDRITEIWLAPRSTAEAAVRAQDAAVAIEARQAQIALFNVGPARQPARQRIVEEQFAFRVFRPDRNPDAARTRLADALKAEIAQLNQKLQLTQAQKDKLELMGRGDIKRFFDRYEALKDEYYGLDVDVALKRTGEIMSEASMLGAIAQKDLFNYDSLLHKSMANTLSRHQLERYEASVLERRQARHRNAIERLISNLEQRSLLPEPQRQKLVDLIMKEIEPARSPGPYDIYYIVSKLGELPEQSYRPFLNASQWGLLNTYRESGRQLETRLRSLGYFANEEVIDEKHKLPASAAKR
jgi:hypothetical protein